MAGNANEIEVMFPGVYRIHDLKDTSKHLIATRNLTPGRSFHGEKLVVLRSENTTIEFRPWDPYRSKLSAAILKGLSHLPISEGTRCLYLGASTGTTVSHLSDIVGSSGRVFAVEVSQRVARELMEHVVKFRRNVVPIVSDARHPAEYLSVYGEVSVVYCDIAQPDQTAVALANCEQFSDREKGVQLMLVVKASSIDALRPKREIFGEQVRMLQEAGLAVAQPIDLDPYDRNHAMIVASYPPSRRRGEPPKSLFDQQFPSD